jgi:membrane-bound serine protease (ClpP class)
VPNLPKNNVFRVVRVLIAVLVTLAGLWGISTSYDHQALAQTSEGPGSNVVLIRLDGAIDAVSAKFIERGLDIAIEQEAELVVLMIDTPGGLLDSTRDIVETILLSPVPFAVYVAPEGAQAASAGTFVGAAADILVMAPATNIGAAAVVSGDGSDLPDTLGEKASQDAAAFIRSIAERRDRNISALEDTVLLATAYSASEAVDLGIADLMAVDYGSLLQQLDGYVVGSGEETTTLDLGDVITTTVDFSLLEQLLAFISNPNIAFLLVSLGGLGVIVELWHPGLWVPGTLGILFLVLGWAGIGQLPFSWAGVALIGLALLLFYLESTAVGIGYFGVAGTISLILGGVFLVGFFGNPAIPGDAPTVSRWLLVILATSTGAFVLWFANEVRIARYISLYKSPMHPTNLVGAAGIVSTVLSPSGEVFVNGEYWTGELETESAVSATAGTDVEVVSVDGNHLKVKPVKSDANVSDVTNSE